MDSKWKVLIGIEGAIALGTCIYANIQWYRIKLFNEEHGLGRMSMWWHLPDLPRLLTFIAKTGNREEKRKATSLLLDVAIALVAFIIGVSVFLITLERLT